MSSATGIAFAPQCSIGAVFAACDDANVVCRIGADIAMACHHILAFAVAALRPFAAISPNRAPLIERQKERNIAQLGVMLMRRVGLHLRIGLSPRLDFSPDLVGVSSVACARSGPALLSVVFRPLCRAGDLFLAIRRIVCAGLFWCSCHSRRSSHSGSLIRGGTDVDASMSSRFYHGDRGRIQL
jgi:hypothetical protein